jgi:hypothetical protein
MLYREIIAVCCQIHTKYLPTVWAERKIVECSTTGISFIAHTAKIAAKILRIRIERKTEDVFWEDQLGFRKEKATGEWTLELYEGLCAYFIDWRKPFDCLNWAKLMQILTGSGIDCRERRLVSKLDMEQSVKLKLDQRRIRNVKIAREIAKRCWLSPILFNSMNYRHVHILSDVLQRTINMSIFCLTSYGEL